MDFIQSFIDTLPVLKIVDIIDILIVAFLIYKLIPVFKSTGTGRIAGIVGGILVVTWLTGLLELYAINFILNQVVAVGLIAVVIIFQPEIRRMIDHMSNIKLKKFLSIEKPVQEMDGMIEQTVAACVSMSRERCGALIVFSGGVDAHFKQILIDFGDSIGVLDICHFIDTSHFDIINEYAEILDAFEAVCIEQAQDAAVFAVKVIQQRFMDMSTAIRLYPEDHLIFFDAVICIGQGRNGEQKKNEG